MTQTPAPTYILVDGENIDATLGMSVLGRRPNPEERPRWDRIVSYAAEHWGEPIIPLFFLNASNGQLPSQFVQALVSFGYRPIPLAGDKHEKVVDIGIQRTLEAIAERAGRVILVSHDGDFVPQISALTTGQRRVGVMGFEEFLSGQLADLEVRGLEIIDLEFEVGAFNAPLPRIRIIPLAEFDPEQYL